ncbi:hypothetical protein [Parvularcula sp. LCG005]|uniref:hypothetical protein n=1 Tax=Parvularcula sp. LCG005 TaxID=3078805 RepID=UPI00294332FB|nr:hypothetical protein [Parvularcula sp. LCG005]WOI54605.1 hypothetical protein RUI03_06300 [Parvularcula sp. LCG005]
MQDLTYYLTLAFSGSDLPRALWLGLIGSLFCTTRNPPWRIFLIVFLIDRIWPFLGMAFSGYGAGEIGAAVSHTIRSVPSDMMTLLIRGLGLFLLILTGYMLRLIVHGQKNKPKSGKLNVPY